MYRAFRFAPAARLGTARFFGVTPAVVDCEPDHVSSEPISAPQGVGALEGNKTLNAPAAAMSTLQKIFHDIAEIKASHAKIKTSIDEIKASHAKIKTSIDEIKASHAKIKTSIDEIKVSNAEIKASVDKVLRYYQQKEVADRRAHKRHAIVSVVQFARVVKVDVPKSLKGVRDNIARPQPQRLANATAQLVAAKAAPSPRSEAWKLCTQVEEVFSTKNQRSYAAACRALTPQKKIEARAIVWSRFRDPTGEPF
jgi:hypothetical protein